MTNHYERIEVVGRQQGATLVVGLVLLLLVTLIGVTAMQGTTVQQKMATNVQFNESAFQAAEDSVRTVTQEARSRRTPPAGSGNILVDSLSSAPGTTIQRTASNANKGTTSTASVAYAGATSAAGYSLGAGSGNFVFHRFRITATGVARDGVSTNTHVQELGRVGPSP